MNCNAARQFLALDTGGDLPAERAEQLHLHLQHCGDCGRFREGLTQNQTLLRSLRQDSVPPTAVTQMREHLFSRLNGAEGRLGWWIRLERFLLIGFRKPRYAAACIVFAAIISATLTAGLRYTGATPDGAVTLLEGDNMLRFPEDYREWVLLGSASQFVHSGDSNREGTVSENVYINPGAYQEYRRTGIFPEGTVMVLESAKSPRSENGVVLTSVKNRRFSDGWGYFRFNEGSRAATTTQALPETAGCVACHRDRAATDHVFTQFYPVLRAASGVL